MFPLGCDNVAICFSDVGSRTSYCVLAVNGIADLHFGSAIDAYQQVPAHRYANDQRLDNVTDWALDQFRKHYQPGRTKPKHAITKDAIFHYVYGVLHDPVYREKYAQNLKREFPRIPLYADFWQWADWGKELMELHIGASCKTINPRGIFAAGGAKGEVRAAISGMMRLSKSSSLEPAKCMLHNANGSCNAGV